ncbi:flippase-like domain-containing protein [Pusillimonas sp. DMV24BSW_D]|uniref:lysylphosphatidylglycerol synthase transmembrane domain-containing protein n=1 Tax=Neopusillimonas aestuarii TaxID=2716226 RepID=UPI00140D6935|nr:lysylphosphatidylglycerol synthase transmembrane domain-containing protein [Pusillimonas sp. DMV24BSW_D]QIM48050.1 flippase-like domain-containing protein [Pusillimonas sp. DMV24BSW_D]
MNKKRYLGLLLSASALFLLFFFIDPSEFIASLTAYPIRIVAISFFLILVNQLLVFFRYKLILSHFGFNVHWAQVFQACALGNLGALVVIPMFGQVLGRQAVLRSANISPAENAVIVAYERGLTAVVSLIIAALGGAYLLFLIGQAEISNLPILEFIFVLAAALAIVLSCRKRGFEQKFFSTILSRSSIAKFIVVCVVTIFSLAAMLLAFAFIFSVVAPNLNLWGLLAVAAVVSFAASIPISFGGWGFREIAAVLILAIFSVSEEMALSSAVLVGLLSILAVVIFGVIALNIRIYHNRRAEGKKAVPLMAARQITAVSLEKLSVWIICFGVALFIFFQIHLNVGNFVLNVNLADPFAVLAVSIILVEILTKRQLPGWDVPYFNYLLLSFVGVFALGLFTAWYKFEVTEWAVSRVVGWFVLFGYLSAGYLVIRYFGMLGYRRVVEIMAISLSTAIIFGALMVPLQGLDIPGFLHANNTSGFEAYSMNRNALAFQVLAVVVMVLPLVGRLRTKLTTSAYDWSYGKLGVLGLAILLAGGLLTASRSAYIAMAVVLLVSLKMRFIDWRTLSVILGTALLVWVGLTNLPEIYNWLYSTTIKIIYLVCDFYQYFLNYGGAEGAKSTITPQVGSIGLESVAGQFSAGSSDNARIALLLEPLKNWISNPVFGGGLGSFYLQSTEIFGFKVIVHNTLIWLLSDLGLVGVIPFLLAFMYMLNHSFRGRLRYERAQSLFLLLIFFGILSVFHEVLYQRIMWFCIGLLLAQSKHPVNTH